jgi:hypothetical protein
MECLESDFGVCKHFSQSHALTNTQRVALQRKHFVVNFSGNWEHDLLLALEVFLVDAVSFSPGSSRVCLPHRLS